MKNDACVLSIFDLVEAMEISFLNVYFESMGVPNFRRGCNFGAAASTIFSAGQCSLSTFSFRIQVA